MAVVVETVHAGDEAVLMVRRSGGDDSYDVIISDIRFGRLQRLPTNAETGQVHGSTCR